LVTLSRVKAPKVRAGWRGGSLTRRVSAAVATMLLPLVAIAAIGVVTFRSSLGALQEFHKETVEEAGRIDAVRDLLVHTDDVGEAYVETRAASVGDEFAALSRRLEQGFHDLARLSTREERDVARAAGALWGTAREDLAFAAKSTEGTAEQRLDPFHDHLDAAAAKLGSLLSLNVRQVSAQIAALRGREQAQLFAALATVFMGLIIAGVLARWLRRSITSPLISLEKAAVHFGSDDLSHQIAVRGDDEFARVGSAFNDMAGKLQKGREELRFQALHDSLTGLPNRALFMQHTEHAIARARRRTSTLAVLYLDLDDFKAVNDTFGHEAGDELLIAVADRLRKCLRAEDVAARLGGDEFGILLQERDVAGVNLVVERLSHSFRDSLSIRAGDMTIGVSIGVATSQGNEELDELLRQADVAMYAAKARGRGRRRTFGVDVDADQRKPQALRADLQHAVQRGEFEVYYQPVVCLETGAIDAVEALVRWDHPERGLLAPARFLDVAEQSGQILLIDKFLLNEACRQVRSWQRHLPGVPNLCACVNLSAKQLEHPGLAEEVAEALRSSGLPAVHLVLEITETALLADTHAAAKELQRLKTLGVRIALDDFGTGYSSLTHLVRFPVDIIKIDRSFVSAIGTGGVRSDLALSLVSLNKTLGLKTVAEGIEQTGQLELLRSAGCEQGQGYLFAAPLPAREFEQRFGGGRVTVPDAPHTTGKVMIDAL
jgi:diguanylate cyclase (GGDEF)-like protein